MNTHDIELPPLHRPQVPLIDADIDLMDIRRLADWCEKTAKEYAREAVRLNAQADPVLYTSQEALDLTSRSDAVISVGLTRVPQMSWNVPLYTAPQPAETGREVEK